MDVTHVNRTEHGEKCIFMHNITTNLHIYTLKCANSAAFPLTPPLTPYLSTSYPMYKYSRAKNLPHTTITKYYHYSVPNAHTKHKRLNRTKSYYRIYPHLNNIHTSTHTNTHGTLPGTDTAHGAKVVRINPPQQHTAKDTRTRQRYIIHLRRW